MQQIYFFESDSHDVAYTQNQNDDGCRKQSRQININDFLHSVGSVHFGGFVQGWINTRESGQIYDSGVSHSLPHIGEYVDGSKQSGLSEKIHRFKTKSTCDCIDNTQPRRQKEHNDGDHYNGRDEIWSIRHHLHDFFESYVFDFIQRECQ
ncbi:hypothetical protein D3C74_389470 [compost metagenome]